MARIRATPKLDLEINFSVSESEARALDALVGYGDDEFIKVFYDKLGSAYMRDHEQGLRTFFTSIRGWMPGILNQMQDARDVFNGSKVARRK